MNAKGMLWDAEEVMCLTVHISAKIIENCVVFSMCVSDDLGVQIRLGVQTPAPLTKAPKPTLLQERCIS